MLRILRWALAVALTIVIVGSILVVSAVAVGAAAGLVAGAATWALLSSLDQRLVEMFRTEFAIAAISIGAATFLGVVALVLKLR